ncbi:hypothetical protein EZV62_012601 [Acer yangbiense]|uniref:Phytocyanin domain-containing protein n=1 Tax=Acer yangbiense TaxID=1000413 RepID=A0A5C7HWQ2_9ROSI|nr:hypothetical protein EZV62_012601 [Acer yangbiense]
MGRIMSMSQLLMALALVASLLQGTAADEYHVGNATGWVSTESAAFYTNWAAAFTFEVVFNFTTGEHNVAVVTKDAFDSCNTANTTNIDSTGPATVTLSTAGVHYFICTIPGHCARQKLSVTVVADKDNPSPPTTTTTNNTSPPPSSASPRGVAFAFVFMSLGIAFFCCG